MWTKVRVWIAIVVFLSVAAYGTYLNLRPSVEVVGTLASSDLVRHRRVGWRLHVVLTQEPDRTYWTAAVPREVISELQRGDVVKLKVATASLRSEHNRARTYGISVGGVVLRSEMRDRVGSILGLVVLPLVFVVIGARRLRSIDKRR